MLAIAHHCVRPMVVFTSALWLLWKCTAWWKRHMCVTTCRWSLRNWDNGVKF